MAQPYRSQTVVYEVSGTPCCSGCGCALAALALIAFLNLGSAVSVVLVAIVAAWISASLLRLAGVHRFHPLYAYAVVPLFLALLNLLAGIVRAQPPYPWEFVLYATIILWVFLAVVGLASRGAARRRRGRRDVIVVEGERL